MMQVENKNVDGDQGEQRNLEPFSGKNPNGQGETEDEAFYYLPRSSPVLSRRQAKKIKKLSSVGINNNHEHGNKNVPETLKNIFPEAQKIPTSSSQWLSQVLDTHDASTVLKDEKYSDKQRCLTGGASASQFSSCKENNLLNPEGSQLEKETITCLKKCLISGADHEEKISEAFYRNSINLDQENAHFVVVDMVLEVLEAAKWSLSQKHSDSFSSTDSGYVEPCDHRLSSNRTSTVSSCSAENLARSLLIELERCWISSEELLGECPLATVSMVSEGEVSLTDEILLKSRLRGTLIWTPPQFEIITSMTPTQRRSDAVASQQFLCAGCGTEIEPRYMKRLRYCDYLGKYFCDGCHGGWQAIIPARVLSNWDFGRYPVCQFSKQILESIREKPLFKITDVAKKLYSQAKELQKFRELQEQLISIKKLLKACRLSKGVLDEFQQLPSHLSDELHLFAMDDLIKIKKCQLLAKAKAIMKSAVDHVEACQLCLANGFICEFCHGKDVLFPFQRDICTRCQECRACFHTSCFRNDACPKCIRLQNRKAARR